MKNKYGFTLIELLAVIVILAIIALIATPIVLNIIKESKETSQLQSANFYLDAVENAVATSTINNKKLSNGNYDILEDGNICIEYEDNECINALKVQVNGEKPKSGSITLKDGKIEEVKLKYENKKVVGYDENKILIFLVPEPYRESEKIEIPDLYNNTLTPVIYDGDNWVLADVTEKWYDYSKQEWANAVILDSSVKKDIGDPITVEGENPDALAMFVWIPRYEYKIEGTYGKGGTSDTSPGEIEINFINSNQKEATADYIIHPAFDLGGEDISGIWVGKFELSHATKTDSLECIDEMCAEADGLRILPNVQSLRSNNVSSFFYSIRSMSKEGNVFRIENNIIDTHMIKNSEWRAVAYLSQSKYGKYGNIQYEGLKKEVYINNSSLYYTGRSGGSYGGNTPINETYKDQLGVTTQYINQGFYTYDGYLLKYNKNTKTETRDMKMVSSTTGNIYGVYDMSGGTWEYVMGVFANSDEYKLAGSSGFKGKNGESETNVEGLEWPNEKYYEVYKQVSYNEILRWYGDALHSFGSSNPWLIRGGCYGNGVKAGVFGSYHHNGSADDIYSTRVVFASTT